MYANDAYIYDFGKTKKKRIRRTIGARRVEDSERERVRQRNWIKSQKDYIRCTWVCVLWASSSSFISLLMVFNSSQKEKEKPRRSRKKGWSDFFRRLQLVKENQIRRYTYSIGLFSLLAHGPSICVHIIIAVNHSFSSPCQQALCLCLCFALTRSMRVCVFFRWKDKRRWMEEKNLRRIRKEWAKYRAVSFHLNKGTNQTKYHFVDALVCRRHRLHRKHRKDTESINYAYFAFMPAPQRKSARGKEKTINNLHNQVSATVSHSVLP